MPRLVEAEFEVTVRVRLRYDPNHVRVQRDAEILVQDRLQLGKRALESGHHSYYENLMIRDGLCSPVIQCYVAPAAMGRRG